MMQLYERQTVFFVDGISKSRQTLEMLISKATQLTSKTLTNCLNVRSTYHRECKTTLRAHRKPVEFIVRQCSVNMALLVR